MIQLMRPGQSARVIILSDEAWADVERVLRMAYTLESTRLELFGGRYGTGQFAAHVLKAAYDVADSLTDYERS